MAGQILYPGDIPAASARVLLLLTTHLEDGPALAKSASVSGPASIQSETYTDTAGRFYFPGVKQGYYTLEARKQVSETALRSQTRVYVGADPVQIEVPPLNLQTAQSVQGRLTAPAGLSPKSRLYLYGKNWSTATDSLGAFTLADLPPGLDLLRIVPDNTALGSLEMAFRTGSDLGVIALPLDNVLRLAEFENGLMETPFSAVFPKGKWNSGDNLLPPGGESTFEPASIRTDFASAFVETDAWRGKSLHVNFKLEGNPAANYGLVGFATGKDPDGFDCTGLDSVVFRAKGSGRIRLEFQTASIIAKYDDWRHFHKQIDLPSQWTRFSIPVSEFALSPEADALKAGMTWQGVRSQVVNILFIADDPADFWLDDLDLYGLSIHGP